MSGLMAGRLSSRSPGWGGLRLYFAKYSELQLGLFRHCDKISGFDDETHFWGSNFVTVQFVLSPNIVARNSSSAVSSVISMSGTIAASKSSSSWCLWHSAGGGVGQSNDNSSGEGKTDRGKIISVKMASIKSSSFLATFLLGSMFSKFSNGKQSSSLLWTYFKVFLTRTFLYRFDVLFNFFWHNFSALNLSMNLVCWPWGWTGSSCDLLPMIWVTVCHCPRVPCHWSSVCD